MENGFYKLEPRFCFLCGKQANKRIKYPGTGQKINASLFGSRDAFRRNSLPFVECETCGMIFADPAPTEEFIDSLYKDSTVEYDELESWIYRSYVLLLDKALPYVRNRDLFVDVGGGSGFLLRYGVERGFKEQIEIEPSEDGRKKFVPPARSSKFICKPFSGNLLKKNSVSMMCVLHTLDHIPNPQSFLFEVFTVLKPGGILVCAVHNTRALSARILGRRSPIYNILHTYLFNMENAKTFFEKISFGSVKVFPYANTYPLWYWFRDIDLFSDFKVRLLSILDKVGLKNIPIKFFAGNIAIIAQKPLHNETMRLI